VLIIWEFKGDRSKIEWIGRKIIYIYICIYKEKKEVILKRGEK